MRRLLLPLLLVPLTVAVLLVSPAGATKPGRPRPTTTTTAPGSTTTTTAPANTTTTTTPVTLSYAGRVGVNSHFFWDSEASATAEMQRIVAGGVHSVRDDFLWQQLEPTKGSYAWSRADNLMAAAAASGVDVLGVIAFSASWASSDPSGAGNIYYPPRDNQDYANFAKAVVARYGRGGTFWATRPTLTPRPLTSVEFWNEPEGFWSWKPNPNPAGYAALVRAASTAVRSVDPNIDVLISGDLLQVRTDGAIVDWLGSLLTADPTVYQAATAYSVHPYPSPRTLGPYEGSDPRFRYGRVADVRAVAVNKQAALPIWITEIGWSTVTNSSEGVTEATQATDVKGALQRAVGEWGAYVTRTFVYSWDKSTGTSGDLYGNYGLRRADNSTKPAWDAITSLTH